MITRTQTGVLSFRLRVICSLIQLGSISFMFRSLVPITILTPLSFPPLSLQLQLMVVPIFLAERVYRYLTF